MASTASNPSALTLSTPSSWHGWLSILRASATQTEIWAYIDPSLVVEPILTKPTLPKKASIVAATEQHRSDLYADEMAEYNDNIKTYKEKKAALVQTLSYIQKSISAEYAIYIYDKSSPWQALRALKAAIEPNSSARNHEVDRQYKALSSGPPRGQNLRQWVNQWEVLYAEARSIGYMDAMSGMMTDYFINSVRQIEPSWSDIFRVDLNIKLSRGQDPPTFMEVINNFRQVCISDMASPTSPSSYAATLQGQTPESSTTPAKSNKTGNTPSKECVCGKKHWYSDCYYLNEARRPKNWKSDPNVVKKIDEAMRDPKIKANVEKAKTRSSRQTSTPAAELPAENPASRIFATKWHHSDPPAASMSQSSYTVLKVEDYDIVNCWILDSGSNIHVCNDSSRFKPTHSTTPGDYLISGSTTYSIEAYGTVDVTVTSPTGKKETVILDKVALIPGFFTNLVSLARAKAAGIFWHGEKDTLYTINRGKQDHFCLLKPHNGHYIIEYNAPPPASAILAASAASTSTTQTASGTAPQQKIFEASPIHLHQILGHAGSDAIAKLPSAIDGLKLSSPLVLDEFRTCEACRLSKAHQIISRKSDNEIPATRPLQRVSYDLIPMTKAHNGDEWISHFVCQTTHYHWVWTHRKKGEATRIITLMVNLSENQCQQKITFLRTDNEQSLGLVFNDLLAQHGIHHELIAPYTPVQNGQIEKAGGVITQKARCMRISANLPADLWPETIAAAAYILNRTPTLRTGMTPFEAIYKFKPTISHMRVYGCKAYPLIYKIPKLQKLEPRAHIGYLVGYSSRNIYRIWVPSIKRVIRIRDVTFDQTAQYQLDDVDAGQLVPEQDLQEAIHILQEIPDSLLANNQDEEEIGTPTTNTINQVDTTPTTPTGSPPKTPTNESPPYQTPPATVTHNATQDPSSSTPASETPVGNRGNGHWEYQPIGTPAPRSQEVSVNLDPSLILANRTRSRQQAHAVAVTNLDSLSGYHAAFASDHIATMDHLHRDKLPDEPKHWKQMLKHPHGQYFVQAANTEFNHLKSRGTFKLSSRSTTNSTILPLVWVFKYKFDDEGYLVKHKARLCVRGDLQKTEQDTAAATLAIRVFRALMALTASFNLTAKQYDAVNAFINSLMNEEIYVDYPEGMERPTNVEDPCLLLLRALYGLKQSPLLWLKEVTSTLLDLGLYPVPGVDCLFTNQWLILFFYVDDFVLLYRSKDEAKFIEFEASLLAKYEIRSLGDLKWFLGIKILRTNDKLYLCQDSYIIKLAEKYHIQTTAPHPKTPLLLDPLVEYEGVATKAQIYAYQQRVGSLTFAATTTRPDIAYATAKLAQFLTNPSPMHLSTANRLLQYLFSTKSLAIVFAKSNVDPIFLSSTDAAFADDQKTRKSSFGYLIQLYGGPIDWKASKQATVTTSSTEAELLALSETARQTLWWKRFFASIHFDTQQQMVINCDNKQTLDLMRTETPRLSTRLRHVDIHSCWLRQEIQAKHVTAEWIPTAEMPADGLTKALPVQKHQKFIKLINMVDIPAISYAA